MRFPFLRKEKQMVIKIYRDFKKRNNSTLTPPDSSGESINVRIKDITDILNPIFTMEKADAHINYVKWNGRFYHCRPSINTNALCDLHCSVDALASWKNDIKNTNGFVQYASNNYSFSIKDNRFIGKDFVTDTDSYEITTESRTWLPDPEPYFDRYGCFALTLISDQATGISGAAATYLMNTAEMFAFVNKMNTQNFFDQIKQDFENPFETVISCRWLPFAKNVVFGVNNATLFVGRHEMTDVKGKVVGDRMVEGYIPNIYIPNSVTDIISFLDKSESCTATIYLPFVGIVPLPLDSLYPETRFALRVCCDILTGDIIYSIYHPISNALICTFDGNCSTLAPISQTQPSSALGLLASTVTTIGGIATSFSNPVVGISAAWGGLLGMFKSAELHTSIKGSISSQLGQKLGYSVQINAVRPTFTQDINDENRIALMGLPVAKSDIIDNYSGGYVQTLGFSVNASCTNEERNTINSLMDSGIYLE